MREFKLRYYPLTALCVVGILFLSFMYVPNVHLVDLPFHLGWDKLVHGLMYTVLVFFALWEGERREPLSGKRYAVILLLALCMGALVEVGQAHLTTWRSGRLDDMVANSIGVVLGLGAFHLQKRLKMKKK